MSLLAPAFLLGLLGIGLPLWLHRLSAENPNKQRFSSLMFLEPGEPRRVLARRLQYLLLLALRVGVLALLALAFAQPTLWRTPSAAGGEGAELHLIVLDTSASMGYAGRWQAARDAALGVIGALRPEDRAELASAGRTFEVLGPPTNDKSVLRQALNTVQPGVFRIDYGQMMRSIDGLARGTTLAVVIDVVTDAQQSSLPTRFGELAPRRAATLVIHDVAKAPAANWAVDSFGGSAVTGELVAGVRSFADEAADKTLSLTQNGKAVADKTVTVPAHGRADVQFAALDLAPGSNRVTVSLTPADGLVADDKRFLALRRPAPRAVLVIAADVHGRDSLFASAALGTLTTLALTPEIHTPSELGQLKLGDYSLVVVTDAGLLGSPEAASLRDYVQSGGGLLLAFGPRSTGVSSVPVTGQSLGATSTALGARAALAIGEIDTTHPALKGVTDLRGAQFTRYLAVTPGTDDRVLIRLDDGAPLLIETKLGAGRVLLFTSSLDREWNDLPVQPVFVPFLAGLANHLLGGAGFSSEAPLGSTLAVQALGLAGGQVFDPQGAKALPLGGGEDVLLDQIGFYEAQGGGRSEVVAVNFDPRESDLEGMDAATVERWRGLGQPAGQPTAPAAAGEPEAAPAPSPLGPWLVILLVGVALVESWVGNWHLKVRRGIAA
jgi:Aerotolerance regulator N-terminal/von Willebrand factor type A domain